MTEHEDLIAEVREEHVPREVLFGYPVEPGEVAEEGYIETCMCGEKYPCDAVRLVKALEKVTAERDELRRALQATDDYRIADWQKLEAERDEAEDERDQLAAAVEQMKQSEHYRLTESERKRFGKDNGCVCPMCSALSFAPYVALDRVKAEAWEEGATAASEGYDLPDAAQIHNPYRRGESNE